jgi:hypothetical protein
MIIDNDTISSVSVDPFIAKFDYNGNCIWIKKITCLTTNDRSSSITIDQNGNVYWNAELSGPGILDTFNLQKGGVLSKVSPNGTVLWAKNEFKDIHISYLDSHDSKLFFSGNTKNDTCLVETDTLISNSSIDVFLCCTDLNGSLLWAKRFGGIGNNYGGSLDFDDNGNMYICGTFSDTLIFKDTITTSSFSDGYIAKLDLSGNLIWIRQSHSSNNGDVWGSGLVSDGDGNTYFIGSLHSGSSTFGQFTISTTNYKDMFLTRYDPNGNCLGIRQFGYAEGFSVQMDALGKVYCSGLFYNTVTIGNTSLTSHGDADIFIAKSDAITGLGGQNRVVQNQLIIYANPNKGTFNIKVPDEIKSFKQAWLFVYDMSGKEIARFNLDNESDTPHFDISNSNPGSYSVKLVQGEKVYSGKMVVE